LRLQPLYRLTFRYTEEWGVTLGDSPSLAGAYFFIAEGRCSGNLVGRFRAANHPLRRDDGTFLPNCQGIIDTEDGATIVVEMRGYGRAYPVGARQVVVAVTHVSDDPRYSRLNDSLAVGCGEVRRLPDDDAELVIDVSELVWEPMAESAPG
jgi:hypothetical protein